MNRTLSVLAILAALTFGACTRTPQEPSAKAQAEAQAQAQVREQTRPVTQPAATGSHACGAPTRTSKACTRLVSNKHGDKALCWQLQRGDKTTR